MKRSTCHIFTPGRGFGRLALGLGAALALVGGLAGTPAARADGVQPQSKNLTLLGIESATVPPQGMIYGALSGTTRRNGTINDVDGSAEIGFGLGSAENGLGVQVSSVITSLRNNIADSGYLKFKLSRRIASGQAPTYVGLTVGHIANWGNASGVNTSATLTVTTFTNVRFSPAGESFPVMFTVGGGTATRKNDTHPGVFAGAGIGLTPNLGASLAWTGDYWDLGAAFRIDALKNVNASVIVNDVLDQRNSRRLTASIIWYLPKAFGG